MLSSHASSLHSRTHTSCPTTPPSITVHSLTSCTPPPSPLHTLLHHHPPPNFIALTIRLSANCLKSNCLHASISPHHPIITHNSRIHLFTLITISSLSYIHSEGPVGDRTYLGQQLCRSDQTDSGVLRLHMAGVLVVLADNIV